MMRTLIPWAHVSMRPLYLIAAFVVVTALALPCVGLSDEQCPAYTIGPEDVVSVTVTRHPEFSGDFLVPADGNINIPAIGTLAASGKSLCDLAADVKKRLKPRLRDPEVAVALKSARPQRVYVLGAVDKPGAYDAKPGWRITEAMAAAGGLTQGTEASDCCVTVLRAGTQKQDTFQLPDVMKGSLDANTAVASGDVITVRSQETIPIYVMGKVKTPGLYRLRKDNSGVMAALSVAGGTLDEAALSKVTISRTSGSTEKVDLAPAVLKGGQEPKILLEPGDTVLVPAETSRIAVMGYVNKPGFFPLSSDQTVSVIDALGMAGGIENKRGNLGAVAILRTVNGKQERINVDVQNFLKSGNPASNPPVQPGDIVYVPQTSKPDWDFVVRSLTAVGIMINPFF
ncbi:SLBB domain-containing protein [bacterium]|nr:SLBB domain-containing protein [bacterium]